MKSDEITKIWMLLQIASDCTGFPEYANIATMAREELRKVNEPKAEIKSEEPKAVPTKPVIASIERKV